MSKELTSDQFIDELRDLLNRLAASECGAIVKHISIDWSHKLGEAPKAVNIEAVIQRGKF